MGFSETEAYSRQKDLGFPETEASAKAARDKAAKDKAAYLIGRRAMSRGELLRKLKEKGFDEALAENAADWLSELGVLDDADYAGMIVRHYCAKGYGVNRLRDELRKRLVPRELWDDAIGENVEEDDTIDRLLASRLKDIESPDRADLKKASDFLHRRGFGWDEIRAALERMENTD